MGSNVQAGKVKLRYLRHLRSCSQIGQDRYILLFFTIFRPKRKLFVDVGAFDGINFSNTRLLYEHGWTGLCVEPCTRNYVKLETLYRGTGVTTAQVAISDWEGVTDLNVASIPNAEDWGSDVSSLNKAETARWPNYRWEKEQVVVTTLNSLLAQHDIREMDLLAIDTEGEDLKVLRGIDLDQHRPALIVVEQGRDRTAILQLARGHGYRLWMDNGQDLFLVRGSKLRVLSLKIIGWIARRFLWSQ